MACTYMVDRHACSDSGVVAKQYRYYDKKTCGLDFAGLLDDLKARPLMQRLSHV